MELGGQGSSLLLLMGSQLKSCLTCVAPLKWTCYVTIQRNLSERGEKMTLQEFCDALEDTDPRLTIQIKSEWRKVYAGKALYKWVTLRINNKETIATSPQYSDEMNLIRWLKGFFAGALFWSNVGKE
jgi:hypothetical protein